MTSKRTPLGSSLNCGKRDERMFPRHSDAEIASEFAEFLAGRAKRAACSHKSTAHPRETLRGDYCSRCGAQLRREMQ